MTTIRWMTDIHLDHIDPFELDDFLEHLGDVTADGFALTGDISNAYRLQEHLERLDEAVSVPLYFVCGNHDCYGGSIAETNRIATKVALKSRNLRYFDEANRVYKLTDKCAVIGHNSWADARFGNFLTSRVDLNDYHLISELNGKDGRKTLLEQDLNFLGDLAAEYIAKSLSEAVKVYDDILVLTHAPPFREAAWHDGEVSNDEWLPHFSSKAFGDALLAGIGQHPGARMTVLCGHTHGEGVANISDNVTVYTGLSEYGQPALQDFIFSPR